MYLVSDQGVAQHERHDTLLGGRTDRDAARVFLRLIWRVEKVRHSSLCLTVDGLRLRIKIVRRHIDDLARQIGVTLSARDPRGMVGRWYRSILGNESSATFGLRITPVAAGFRGCFK
jgi:hypothetical protein